MKRVILIAALSLAACRQEQVSIPEPVAMTADSLGHYCQMNLLEHPGPKAQVHLKDNPAPLFFSQVRDAIAYQRMPEQAATITAIYVSDMTQANWDDPGADNWMALEDAHFVTGSRRDGGMGAPETIPFSDQAAAAAFVAENGGRIASLEQIADAEVLEAADKPGAESSGGDDADYLARLRALGQDTEKKE